MYKIGDFAKIVDIPVRTLRFYDTYGVLQPSEIDNFTGYRYYSDENIKTVIQLQPQRLFNDYGHGGYLLYKLDEFDALSDIKIFSYGLGDVFSKDVLPDSAGISSIKRTSNIEKLLEKYDFDVILTAKMYSLHYYLNARCDWDLVQSDEHGYVYVKNNSCKFESLTK